MPYAKKHDTICWECEKASGGCSWSRDFIPVEGWNAVPTKIQQRNSDGKSISIDSFDVVECPEFELMELLKMRKDENVEVIRHIEGESIADRLLRRKYQKGRKERERE